MADLANQDAEIEVHELVDFEGGVGLFALSTNVTFVIKFLQQFVSKRRMIRKDGNTLRSEESILCRIVAIRHLTTLQKCS